MHTVKNKPPITIGASVQRQGGFNLIEVLISLLVLAMGLLGLAALQNFSLRATHQSLQRTQAVIALSDIVDRMRTNPMGVVAGNYDVPAYTNAAPAAADCITVACIPLDTANYDIAAWINGFTNNQALGPSAEGRIRLIRDMAPASRQYEVAVRWQEGDLLIEQTMNVHLCAPTSPAWKC